HRDLHSFPTRRSSELTRVKINPLATWSRSRVATEFLRRDLPRHPLEADGYLSIGCLTCTDRVRPNENLRAGRWRGRCKTECGIRSEEHTSELQSLRHL